MQQRPTAGHWSINLSGKLVGGQLSWAMPQVSLR